jgi:hypothetical protein
VSTRSGSNGAPLKCRRNSVSRPTQPQGDYRPGSAFARLGLAVLEGCCSQCRSAGVFGRALLGAQDSCAPSP